MKFLVGDIVRYTYQSGDNYRLPKYGALGVVKEPNLMEDIQVEFFSRFDGGHDGNGGLREGHGRWFSGCGRTSDSLSALELVESPNAPPEPIRDPAAEDYLSETAYAILNYMGRPYPSYMTKANWE